eukprot:CAMPEP_0177395058 /NCGR_PEP_ID=MMETSP0368-20130122/55917_1 /TAXON_ID=447022 ORGANISM="Scrippsiella hangoei-like, Strain SHHI-4" /NCGR_SAMPLE_ID=MMETSP0368 /ASSEMBLY_ACC=CAM_ASM_000363 /LENGTH=51 /DNA_ID=CAMNT_0018861553 /DNA_START=29 /DNA_END=181 /DNA_ORIENTATION=-
MPYHMWLLFGTLADACECMPDKQAAPQLKPGMISRGHVRPDGARPAATNGM